MPRSLPWRRCRVPQLQMGLCPHSPHPKPRLCAWWSSSAELSLSLPSSRLVPCLCTLRPWASAASHAAVVLRVRMPVWTCSHVHVHSLHMAAPAARGTSAQAAMLWPSGTSMRQGCQGTGLLVHVCGPKSPRRRGTVQTWSLTETACSPCMLQHCPPQHVFSNPTTAI